MRWIVTLLLGLSLHGPVAEAEHPLMIGVEQNHYLPHYAHDGREYSGFAREILDAFFQSQGYVYQYRALPVARLYSSFIAGQVDFKYPDNALWRPELKQHQSIVYSDPVVSYVDGVSVLRQHRGRRIDELNTLATVRGFTVMPWSFRIAEGQITLIENDSFRGMVEQALIGRVDGIYANVDVVRHFLATELARPQALVFDSSMPYNRGYYRLATIRHPQVIHVFNTWLQNNKKYVNDLKKTYQLESE